MRRSISGALAAAAVTLLATACASSTTTPPITSGTSAPATPQSSAVQSAPPSVAPTGGISPNAAAPACPTSSLHVTLGRSDGAAGSVYQTIDFTNAGSASCTLFGYPGVSLTGGDPAKQIGAAAARDTSKTPAAVTVAPGQVASAVVQIVQAGNYPAATCQPAAASALFIYPPNQTVPVSVPYTATGCTADSVTILHVGPVVAGSGG